ncbi:MAG: hypothetical protein FWE10_05705 [Rikenellaceae bacterium]|nr:hypothetical protein [Rikenellaceae bacterium]MCL2693012.1 hypothetical protein [Rikenellaceae bacterium]
MNKRRERYCKLRTIAEVQAERSKLRKMMRANEADLADDWAEVRYALSPANLMNEVMSRVVCRSPFLRNAVAGVRTVVDMIRGRRASHSEHSDDCGCGC